LQAIEGSTDMLSDARVATRLPAGDLGRAREFYAEKLGLEPVDQRPGGLLYRCAGGEFALFLSTGASSGTFTQIAFEVDDLDALVAELTRRGVAFEEFDGPGLRTINGIADVAGNYPSKHSSGERAAWVRDSEGNLLGVAEALPQSEKP
jgi:catechol 2,3-dioxygenase-like lactoylglutathione lyase family enzyme